MKLIHQNATIELPDDDPRVAVIELMLFGRSTLPLFDARGAAVPEPPVETPKVPVPEKWIRFWKELEDASREELKLLAQGEQQVDALAAALRRVGARPLQGLHNATNRVARSHRIGRIFHLSGHARKRRRFWITAQHAGWVRALVEGVAVPDASP